MSWDIYVMNADGSGQTRLTTTSAYDSDPAWSPDGAQIVFVSDRDGNTDIYKMNADGSGQTRLTDTTQREQDPVWSPDGARIAFERFIPSGATSPKFDIFTMNPSGSDQVDVTAWAPDASFELDPEWSPDGSKIAYAWGPEDYEIAVMNADGSGAAKITNNPSSDERHPAWSPDGSTIVFASDRNDPNPTFCSGSCQDDLYAMGSGGGPQTRLTNAPDAAFQPDWQPLPPPGPGVARPKGATPFQTYFTLAYKPCVSPNEQHGAPLAVLSCSPPEQASDYLTVGTLDANDQPAKSVGSLRLDVKPGKPATPENEADVKATFTEKDIRNKSDLSDYTGELGAIVIWRDTDKWNGPIGSSDGSDSGTSNDLAIPINPSCEATADMTIGSTCNMTTTLNALVIGMVQENRRMNVELGQVQVYDGGADGNPNTTGDNTLFLTQGIFVP